MAISQQTATDGTGVDHQVVIVGAGFAGIYQLWRARQEGFDVVLLEAGSGPGGTWYWNRYPGARLDSESYSYQYDFAAEVVDEWEWSEHFVGQPELERYVNFVVDRLELRPHMRFNARVTSAEFDEDANTWTLTTGDGATLRSHYVIAATGILSAPIYPQVAGREDFGGESYHTGLWPKEPVDFSGKRVGVVGTGASGVQLIAAIGEQVGELTVFQRTPNWVQPLMNGPITPEEQEKIKAELPEMFTLARSNNTGFLVVETDRKTFDDSKEERRARYEAHWTQRGPFKPVFSLYGDMLTDKAANDEYSKFVAEKIRERVHDPEVAEKLIPKDHGYAMKRPPMETNYLEVYNQPNVTLVDLQATPIVRVDATGIETTDGHHELDMIVWATGFDALSGALSRMGIQGVGGVALTDHWAGGARNYLGIQCAGFPNLLFAGGPISPGGNLPRCTELSVDFITDLLVHAREQGVERIEAEAEAEQAWVDHADEMSQYFLVAESAWYHGANVPGKPRRNLLYGGGRQLYIKKLAEVIEADYEGFQLSRGLAEASR